MNVLMLPLILGHKEIDKEHEFLITSLHSVQLNAFNKYIMDTEILGVLQRLKNAMIVHSSYEEGLMGTSYPLIKEHKDSHESIILLFERAEKYLSGHTISDILEEIISHINGYDRELVRWLKKEGIK